MKRNISAGRKAFKASNRYHTRPRLRRLSNALSLRQRPNSQAPSVSADLISARFLTQAPRLQHAECQIQPFLALKLPKQSLSVLLGGW